MTSSASSPLTSIPLSSYDLTIEQKERLALVLDRYLTSLEDAVPLDVPTLIHENADLAEPLREYFGQLQQLHNAAIGCNEAVPASPLPLPAGARQLGDFLLGREIGRGGMGIVYEAEQISLDRRVAVKVLPFAAVLDSKQIARFKTEAQAAAQVCHSHIVPVFAVGVERGVHYYAMQLIDSQPLDEAVAELRANRRRRPRPIRLQEDEVCPAEAYSVGGIPEHERPESDETEAPSRSLLSTHSQKKAVYFRAIARLGVQAAEALHAAHEHGIVHRDIKPSNLLLDESGKLWVTDFGLARVQQETSFSRTGDVIGTLRYMSPEQAAGKTALIDPRTDIYALGATLYELMTLRPAVWGKDSPDLLRRIASEAPIPPRQIEPHVPLALQNVILKALARSREERYDTAQAFADDLQRFLLGQPIIARPPTPVVRLTKWAMRHRQLVAIGICALVLATLGLTASTILVSRQTRIAQQSFERAEDNRRAAQAAVDRLGSQFAERLSQVPAAATVRRDLLLETMNYYQQFAEQAKTDPNLKEDRAVTYSKIGSVANELGNHREALDSYQKALALYEQLSIDTSQNVEFQRRRGICLNNVALALQRLGRVTEARRIWEQAIALQTRLSDTSAAAEDFQLLATSHSNLGLLLSKLGERREAASELSEAIRLQQLSLQTSAEGVSHVRLATMYNNLSSLYIKRDADRAVECYQAALVQLQQAERSGTSRSLLMPTLISTYDNLGTLQLQIGLYDQAVASFVTAIEQQRSYLGDLPHLAPMRRDLAVSLNNCGLAQTRLEQYPDAEQSFRESLSIHMSLLEQSPDEVSLRSSLGGVYNNLGIVLESTQRPDKAAISFQHAVDHQLQASYEAPQVRRYRSLLSQHYVNLGRVWRENGKPDQALETALRRRDLWRGHPTQLFEVAEEIADAAALTAEPAAAAEFVVATIELALALGGEPPADFASRGTFATFRDEELFQRITQD